MGEHVHTVVIGGGQAGLAMSAVLGRDGREHVVLERGHVGERWRTRVPVFDARGRPLQRRGVTDRPGLYFLGLHWMHTFKSGLFSGVGIDAEHMTGAR